VESGKNKEQNMKMATIGGGEVPAHNVDISEIFAGVGAESAAQKALQVGFGPQDFLREQLARSAGSKRSSKWKDGIRMALIPMPEKNESKRNFVARARMAILNLNA
jgi:hypothetical protein